MSLVAVGCADSKQRRIRTATYPEGFHFITRDEIRDTMTGLAYWIDELDALMETREGDPADAERIVAILSEIQKLANGLKQGSRSNHPRINRYAPELQRDVNRALREAQKKPPNYYFAGTIGGSCEYCHVPRHDSAGPPDPGVEVER